MKFKTYFIWILLILISCQKEVIIKDGSSSPGPFVSSQIEWKESPVDSLVNNLNFISANTENSILHIVSSSDLHCRFDTISKKWTFNSAGLMLNCSTNQFYLNGTPNYKNGLFVTIKGGCVTISCINPKIYGQRFSLSDIDPLFQQPLVSESSNEINSSITENGVIYIPVLTTINNTPIIYRIDTKITFQDSSNGQFNPSNINVLNKTIIPLPSSGYTGGGARVAGNIGNIPFFYSNSIGKTFIINEDNTVNVVYNGCLYNIIENNGLIFALDSYYPKLLISHDRGISWEKFCGISSPKIRSLISFDEKLFSIVNRNLYEVTIQNDTITTKEINLQGLGYKSINSINKLGSNVYVTTNAGLYSKPYSSFYSYK